MPSSSSETEPLFSGDQPDRRQWTLAIAGGMASYLDSSILVALGVGLVLLKKEFHIGTGGVGALSSVLTFAVAAGAFVGGRIADMFGRVRVFTVYILIYAAGTTVMALAPNEAILFTGVIIGGFAAGADLPTSVAVISERSPAGAQGRLVSATQLMWFTGIAVTQLLGFALSGLGVLGIRIIFGELALVAVAAWAVRRFSPAIQSLEEEAVALRGTSDSEAPTMRLREILGDRTLILPALLIGAFYVFWNLVANTLGQFQTYFLITVGGAGQTLATGINVALLPVGFLCSLFFVRIVDGRWRNTVFVVGGLVQVVAMTVAGLGNGVLLVYVVALVIYAVGANVSGEANYKVWTQESLPVPARATVQGLTYSVGRFACGLFALFTPTLLRNSSSGVLWLLAAFALIATTIGVAVIRITAGRRPGSEVENPVSAG